MHGAMPPLMNVGVAMFLNGLFGIFMVCSGLCINKRHGGHGTVRDGSEVELDSEDSGEESSDDENEKVHAWDGGKLGRALAAQDSSRLSLRKW